MWKRMYIARGRTTEEGKGARGQVVIMTQRRFKELWRKLGSMRLVLASTAGLSTISQVDPGTLIIAYISSVFPCLGPMPT
jgi:hypothetical protein